MKLNKTIYPEYKEYEERIIQFGEGNFLRAFADWIIDKMNKELNYDSSVLVIQPRDNDTVYRLNNQDGLYTVLLSGIQNGKKKREKEIINCISRGLSTYKEYDEYLKSSENPNLRFMISNTTEAGIVYDEKDKLEDRPQESFPGKLTAFLYNRYKHFNGDPEKGLLFLPCELIERNGDELRRIILKISEDWELGNGFIDWIKSSNVFYNTLVDRIVSGYPSENIDEIQKRLGYIDDFIVEGEIFHLWVIEGPKEIQKEFPANKLNLNVLFVDDLTPYRERKVRILNGAHTSIVPVAYLHGLETVKQAVEDDIVGRYLREIIFDEIIPTLNLDKEELIAFANSVIDRFENPFMEHYLMDISLNSMSKFKTRVLPSLIEYSIREKKLPNKLVFSLAAMIYFYKGKRNDEKINIQDDPKILSIFEELWDNYSSGKTKIDKIVKTILGLEDLWEQDLNEIEGLTEKTSKYLKELVEEGIEESIIKVLK